MAGASACPTQQDLDRLLAGQVSVVAVEHFSQHVSQCSQCRQRLGQLRAEDTLTELIRAKQPGPPMAAALRRLSEQLQGLQGIVARPGPTGATGNAADRELFDFLAAPQAPDELGRLGPYRILKVLGTGGMGVVFQAEDPQLKRRVALKAMKPALASSEAAKKRFLREAQATAAIKHDHIVTIYQVGQDRGVPYLAMEFLEGLSLDDYLKKGKAPTVGQILRIGREVALGLAAAHQGKLIHRDIKPANLWLDASARGRVKILDFGLARSVGDDTQATQPGAIVGTPAYMAPEQAGAKGVDHRSDLYSLGAVLYRLCTGQLPFQGDTTMAVLMALSLETPKHVRELNAAVPPGLADLVMRLLAKNPAQRPASALQVVQAIQVIERQPAAPVASRPVPKPGLPDAKRRRSAKDSERSIRWLGIAAAAVVVVGGVVLGGLMLLVTADPSGTGSRVPPPGGTPLVAAVPPVTAPASIPAAPPGLDDLPEPPVATAPPLVPPAVELTLPTLVPAVPPLPAPAPAPAKIDPMPAPEPKTEPKPVPPSPPSVPAVPVDPPKVPAPPAADAMTLVVLNRAPAKYVGKSFRVAAHVLTSFVGRGPICELGVLLEPQRPPSNLRFRTSREIATQWADEGPKSPPGQRVSFSALVTLTITANTEGPQQLAEVTKLELLDGKGKVVKSFPIPD